MHPHKVQTITKPHHNTKNQSFLSVPFQLNQLNTNASKNKSIDNSKKIQIPTKKRNLMVS
tara:strand:- start:1201 stop:1380 length:180 start_codon:yes stop_codon:yes gene_type:complete